MKFLLGRAKWDISRLLSDDVGAQAAAKRALAAGLGLSHADDDVSPLTFKWKKTGPGTTGALHLFFLLRGREVAALELNWEEVRKRAEDPLTCLIGGGVWEAVPSGGEAKPRCQHRDADAPAPAVAARPAILLQRAFTPRPEPAVKALKTSSRIGLPRTVGAAIEDQGVLKQLRAAFL